MSSIGLDERSNSMSTLARASRPGGAQRRIVSAVFPPPTLAVRLPLLAAAAVCSFTFAAIYAFVSANRASQIDASVERYIQSLNLGPLVVAFPFFSWVGGPGGIYMQLVALALVLALNPRAWLPALLTAAGGLSYFYLVHLANRPRP